MNKLPPVNPQYPDETVEPQIQGHQMVFAPIQPITAQVGGPATGTYNSTAEGLINNHTARINDIENALIKLGLLRHS